MKQQQSKPLFQALFALLFCGVCASLEDGVVPLMCPGIGEPPLVINDSDLGSFAKINIFEGKDVLCTLIEADLNVVLVAEDGTVSKRDILSLTKNRDYSVSNLKPVGRSYNGNEWEAAPGDFSSLVFDCSFSLYGKGGGGNCLVMLPKPKKGRHYLLKSHDYGHELTPDDLTARFLEKATFGPTKADIEAFTSSEIWVCVFHVVILLLASACCRWSGTRNFIRGCLMLFFYLFFPLFLFFFHPVSNRIDSIELCSVSTQDGGTISLETNLPPPIFSRKGHRLVLSYFS